MHRSALLLVALLFALPGVSTGAGVYIPKMGIRLNDLPDNVTASKLSEYFDAESVSIHIGNASLSILRLESAVPAGVALTDATYRKALADDFDDKVESKDQDGATSVAGNAAWAWSRSSRVGYLPSVQYTSVTYVIVNDHLYRFKLGCIDPVRPQQSDARSPDLRAAMDAIANVTFEPVVRPEAASDSQARPKIPRMIAGLGDLYYPDAAVRRNQEGVVDVEFSIDGKGHAVDVKETYAAFPDLGKKIPGFLQNATFKVPPDWEANGHRAARFDMEFQFSLGLSAHGCREAPESRVPGASVISLCRSRLPPLR